MLQQTLKLCVRTTAALGPSTQCQVCACRCGATFGNNGGAIRHVWATSRRSPAARAKEEGRTNKAKRSADLKPVFSYLHKKNEQGLFSTKLEQVAKFLNAFDLLLAKSRASVTVDPKKMREIMIQCLLDDEDCWEIAHAHMVAGDSAARHTGKRMLLSMSRAGVEEATIRVMAHAVLEAKKKPDKLKALEIGYAKRHLAQIASEKRNFRAMVCEGKVARALGDEERAIEMWTDAMAAAVEDAETREREALAAPSDAKLVLQRDPLELSSPWIELMLLHHERSEFKGKDEGAQCRWAMEIGCKQDDPLSFYYASTFVKVYEKSRDNNSTHIPTSAWLYNLTKAASSSHPVAAYELARFYAESGWKYLDDEPPEHVKPTPFDSFPASSNTLLWHRMLALFGRAEQPESRPEASLFHNAIFPHTAKDRYALAIEWLESAIQYTYVPAYLFRAQLHTQKELWGMADAPQAALDLSDDRYDYASKQDWEAGRAIEKPPEPERPNPPNPFYSPASAQHYLREVFFAHEAYHYSIKAKKAYAVLRRRGLTRAVDEEDDILDESLYSEHGDNIQKWFRFPEVRDMYEDQLEGLHEDAKKLCDEQGWNIYDYDDGLIYKAGSGMKRAIGKLIPKLNI